MVDQERLKKLKEIYNVRTDIRKCAYCKWCTSLEYKSIACTNIVLTLGGYMPCEANTSCDLWKYRGELTNSYQFNYRVVLEIKPDKDGNVDSENIIGITLTLSGFTPENQKFDDIDDEVHFACLMQPYKFSRYVKEHFYNINNLYHFELFGTLDYENFTDRDNKINSDLKVSCSSKRELTDEQYEVICKNLDID